MSRIVVLAIAFLINAATVCEADTSYCGQVSELAAARLRWAAARQSRVDPVQTEKNCRAYGIHFYETGTARQAVSIGRDGMVLQRDLAPFDSGMYAFNNLIHAGS